MIYFLCLGYISYDVYPGHIKVADTSEETLAEWVGEWPEWWTSNSILEPSRSSATIQERDLR